MPVPTDKIEILTASRLFGALTRRELLGIVERCTIRPLSKGAVLCRSFERPDALHVVLSGRAGLFIGTGQDRTLIDFYGPGEAMVLPAVLFDRPCHLSTRMIEKGLVLSWPADDFRRQLEVDLSLSHAVLHVMAQQWQKVVEQVNQLKTLSANERLGEFLLGLAAPGNGRSTFNLPASRSLIASRMGVTPQSLSRAFASLRRMGVNGSGRRVTIDDPIRLREALTNHRDACESDLSTRLPRDDAMD